MLGAGFTLADLGERVSWRALVASVRHARRESALFRVLYPEGARWGELEHLTAGLVDSVQLLVWLGTEDARKNRNRPAPLARPDDSGATKSSDGNHVGADAIPVTDFQSWWDSQGVTNGD